MIRVPTFRILALWAALAAGLSLGMGGDVVPWGCLEGYEELHNPEVWRFKALHLRYKSGADNVDFIERVVEGDIPKGMLFFHVENAILKLLTEKYFHDKELTGAVEGLYTKLFFENLAKLPNLKAKVVYSDYKTARLGFSENTRKLRELLAVLHETTAKDFAREMEKYPSILALVDKLSGIEKEVMSWHMAGIGHTPDEAATAARLARYRFEEGKKFTPYQDFNDPKVQQELSDGVAVIEKLRRKATGSAVALFGEKSEVMATFNGEPGDLLLSPDALDIIRRYHTESEHEYREHAREAFIRRFQLQIPGKRRMELDAFLMKAREYYRTVDYFAPSIYERSEILNMGLAEAEHGVLVLDMAAQNARNIFHAMDALNRATRTSPPEGMSAAAHAVRLARKNQDKASRDFLTRRARLGEVLASMGINGQLLMSGDDVVFAPSRPLSEKQKIAVAQLLADLGVPGDYRMAFLPRQYEGSTQMISKRQRAHYLSAVEQMEKKLRFELEGAGVSRATLREILFAVDIIPSAEGGARINLIIRGKADGKLEERVREVWDKVLPPGFKKGGIDRTPLDPLRGALPQGGLPGVRWSILELDVEKFLAVA